MCKALEDMCSEVVRETIRKTKEENVHRWITMGFPFDMIAKGEDLTIEQVKEIAAQSE